jgi:hypothetical protein
MMLKDARKNTLMLSITLCFGILSTKNRNRMVSFSKMRSRAFLKKEVGLRICMRTHPLATSWYFAPNSLQEENGCKENKGHGFNGYEFPVHAGSLHLLTGKRAPAFFRRESRGMYKNQT